MAQVEFNYEQKVTMIQAGLTDSFNDIVNKFVNKTNLKRDNIYCIFHGKELEHNEILGNKMNDSEKDNKKISILVFPIDDDDSQNDKIIKSNDIICPECKEICRYEIIDHKIKLYDCKNNHKKENIKLDEYMKTQNINLSKIICDRCKNTNRGTTTDYGFFYCLGCKMNLCPLCKSVHDNNHSIINYDNKEYICHKHNESFVKYCKNCKENLCFSCIKKHKKHDLLAYENELVDINILRKNMNLFEKVINQFKNNLEEIMKKFKKIMDNMDIFYKINNDILTNYEKCKNRNYMSLLNLNTINESIKSEISKIIDNYSYGYNLNGLLYLYSEMTSKNEEIQLKYIIKKDNKEKVRIFGQRFVNNNIQKCKVLIDDGYNEEYDLRDFLEDIDIMGFYKDKYEINIKLKGINNITDMSGLFQNCDMFQQFPDISKWDISNVNNLSWMFYGCKSIAAVPDISSWKTWKVANFGWMFYSCESMIILPDISNWITSNAIYMSFMFHGCKSLFSLPDISNWDTSNVIDISHMFNHCKKLTSIPDINKWDISNVSNLTWIFDDRLYKSLKIPSKFKMN